MYSYVSQVRQSKKRNPPSLWFIPSAPIHFYLPVNSKSAQIFFVSYSLTYEIKSLTLFSASIILLLHTTLHTVPLPIFHLSLSSSHTTLPTRLFQIQSIHILPIVLPYDTTYLFLQYYLCTISIYIYYTLYTYYMVWIIFNNIFL